MSDRAEVTVESPERCACCESDASLHLDDDLGPVCTGCFVLLTVVTVRLKMQAREEGRLV